jgi:hypothetical protein
LVNARTRFRDRVSFYANYTLNRARSDTDGANAFPADSDALAAEYGRSSVDIRHHFTGGGSFDLPWDIRLNPFIIARSGAPFNITTGLDTNGDNLFTERPALATDLSRPSVVVTEFGAFDLDPLPGQQIIPRNFGEGPGYFRVNLRVAKTFGIGASSSAPGGPGGQAGPGGNRPGGSWGPWSQGRGGRGRGGPSSDAKFRIILSLSIRNLFNRTNLATPVGNLSSPLFGGSVSTAGGRGFGQTAGNRRIEAEIRFRF